ncbi:hypothetical protein Tco_0565778 [Tanacetum coccineum]
MAADQWCALEKCILEGPYQPTTVTIPAVHATEKVLYAVPKWNSKLRHFLYYYDYHDLSRLVKPLVLTYVPVAIYGVWGFTYGISGIHGLFSGWYCGLAGRRVTLRVSMSWAKGVTTGTLVRYETSCSHLSVIYVIDWIGLDCIGLVVHASLYDSSFIVLQCFLYYHSEYRGDKKDVRKSG